MSEQGHPAWEEMRLAEAMPLAIVNIQTPMGDYFFAERPLRPSEITILGTLFNKTVKFSSSTLFNGGRLILENAGRLRSASAVRESVRPTESAIIASVGNIERPVLEVELDNGDGGLSQTVGEQYLLGRSIKYAMGFAALNVSRALTRISGRVTRIVLTATTMTLTGEG